MVFGGHPATSPPFWGKKHLENDVLFHVSDSFFDLVLDGFLKVAFHGNTIKHNAFLTLLRCPKSHNLEHFWLKNRPGNFRIFFSVFPSSASPFHENTINPNGFSMIFRFVQCFPGGLPDPPYARNTHKTSGFSMISCFARCRKNLFFMK